MAETSRIFIVDDSSVDLGILGELLSEYRRNFAVSGSLALSQIQAMPEPPDLILLDVMMPQMDGFEVCRRLKIDERTREIPVIFITSVDDPSAETIGLGLGAVDYISKPYSAAVVKARVKTHLALKLAHESLAKQNVILEDQVTARTVQLTKAMAQVHRSTLETIVRLSRAAEFRDECTGEHVVRMSRFSAAVSKRMGFSEREAEVLLYSAPMHDIGKIGIPDHILLKPGKLDDKEYECMKTHTSIGAKILSGSDSAIIKQAEVIALTHHERWDGSGYPNNLKGTDIPIRGRVVAIADVFDALTTERPYKAAYSIEKSVEMILAGRGQHFDPGVCDAFVAALDEIVEIKARFKDRKSID